jgi:hypothetical protein
MTELCHGSCGSRIRIVISSLARIGGVALVVVIGNLCRPGGCYPPLMQAADIWRGYGQGQYVRNGMRKSPTSELHPFLALLESRSSNAAHSVILLLKSSTSAMPMRQAMTRTGMAGLTRPSMRGLRSQIFHKLSYCVSHVRILVVRRLALWECRYVAPRPRCSRTTGLGLLGCTSLSVIELHDVPRRCAGRGDRRFRP